MLVPTTMPGVADPQAAALLQPRWDRARGLLLTDAPEQALLGDGFGELARDQAPEPPLSLCVGAIALGRLAFVDGAPEAGPEATEKGVFRFGAVVRGQPGFAVQRIPGRAGWNEENLHERAGCPTG